MTTRTQEEMKTPEEQRIAELEKALQDILGNVDYTRHCCDWQSPIGACLPPEVIEAAWEVLEKYK